MQGLRSDDTGEAASVPNRARSFLAYGIAVSVALHLAALPLVRASPTPAQETPPDLIVTQRPTPPPARPPTPSPTPAPRFTPPPHARAAPPKPALLKISDVARTATHRGGRVEHPNSFATGSPDGMPGATTAVEVAPAFTVAPATSIPLPSPSPLACSRPDVAPATLRAAEPEMPALAQQQGISGTVEVIVSLDAASRVVATRVRSSPSGVLNAAAVAAARASQFRTEVRDCAPISADYVFRVDFSGE
jgi:TonB family protein